MKQKINKKKIIICIVIIITLITLPTFGRYVYNNARDLYLKSQNFSFSSDLLTATGKTYKYANWSGVDDYELDLQLYSYENELSLFQYGEQGLQYTITCEVEDESKATAHFKTVAGDSTETDYIPNETNVKDIKIYLRPKQTLRKGETIKVIVTASTTEPYKKTIKATFNIKITGQNVTYSIEDEPTSVYATLKIVNTKTETNRIKVSFNPEDILIDVTDEFYQNRIASLDEFKVVDDIKYVSSITFDMEALDVKNIIFYKRDIEANYTYPGGSYGSLVVSITESSIE